MCAEVEEPVESPVHHQIPFFLQPVVVTLAMLEKLSLKILT